LLLGGIDEAGRGSILGPLVIAGVSFDINDIKTLREIAITDSKKLSILKREKLFDNILLLSNSVFICKIKCETIDKYVNVKGLNQLESKYMTIVAENIYADKIIIDCCDVDTYRFQQAIKQKLKKRASIYCFHKADLDNIIVSAASIIAKVVRDREINKLKESIGKDIGSGYPSDPKTREFINRNDFLNILNGHVRLTWKPIKSILIKKNQTKLYEIY
jgi:ribonuclease HII